MECRVGIKTGMRRPVLFLILAAGLSVAAQEIPVNDPPLVGGAEPPM